MIAKLLDGVALLTCVLLCPLLLGVRQISLHWTLDVTFREDQCRVRTLRGPVQPGTRGWFRMV